MIFTIAMTTAAPPITRPVQDSGSSVEHAQSELPFGWKRLDAVPESTSKPEAGLYHPVTLITAPPLKPIFEFTVGTGDAVGSVKAEAPLEVKLHGLVLSTDAPETTAAPSSDDPLITDNEVDFFRPFQEYNFGIRGFVFSSPSNLDTLGDLLQDLRLDDVNGTAKSRPAKSPEEFPPTGGDHVSPNDSYTESGNESLPYFAGLSQTNVVEQFTLYKGVTVILPGEEEYYEGM